MKRSIILRHFKINDDSPGYTYVDENQHSLSDAERKIFLESLKIKNHGEAALSLREMEVLSWLHKGKTTHEVAIILNLSDITVHKHIANIKRKINCYTQFQLGGYFAKLICIYHSYRSHLCIIPSCIVLMPLM